jgi:hypothetical protein
VEKGKELDIREVQENLDKLNVLSDLFHEITSDNYEKREDLDVARLKLSLIKKEMLLSTYLISKEIETISP